MRIAMIGTGYVGLVSGACFSEFGVSVTCVDKDAGKIERLTQGEVPIFEPGLDKLVASNAAAGRLSFTTDLNAAVNGADAVFIAVGTPSRRGDGHADLSYVFAAATEIAEALAQRTGERTVVVTKSTVPVGTGLSTSSRRRCRPTASMSPRTRSSCAKGQPFGISCGPIGWSSVPRATTRGQSWGRCTGRSISWKPRWSSPP